jgi:hypothetical protein
MGNEYFDLLGATSVNKNSYVLMLVVGQGDGHIYLSPKVKFIEAIDPSDAVFSAMQLNCRQAEYTSGQKPGLTVSL